MSIEGKNFVEFFECVQAKWILQGQGDNS